MPLSLYTSGLNESLCSLSGDGKTAVYCSAVVVISN
jgi:hypothetical protein